MKNPYKIELSAFRFDFHIYQEFNYSTKKELIITGYSGFGLISDYEKDLFQVLYSRLCSLLLHNDYYRKCTTKIYKRSLEGSYLYLGSIDQQFITTEKRPFVLHPKAYTYFEGQESNARIEAILYNITGKCQEALKKGQVGTTIKRPADQVRKTVSELLDFNIRFETRQQLIAYCSKVLKMCKIDRNLVESFYFTYLEQNKNLK